MPWKEASAVDQRVALVNAWATGRYTITSLAAVYGISRQKAHKWIKRFREEGTPGLEDRKRTPRRQPTKTTTEIRELVVALRGERRRWGAPKIRW